MKRITSLIAFAVVVAFCLTVSVGTAMSADKMIDAPITLAVEKLDKNGNAYVRFIVPEKRSLGGVDYETGVAVMAFGPMVAQAKTYKTGDQLKCIASSRDYQGRTSYTVQAFIK